MGFWSRVGGLFRGKRSTDTTLDAESFFNGGFFSAPSATGISINQQTALQSTAVMACVRVLAEDVSKMTPRLFRRRSDGGRDEVTDTPLAQVLWQPNDWQTWPEYCRQMVTAFCLRGNAFSVILRNRRGDPLMLVPINPDRVSMWQSPDGGLFWLVTRQGLHELAVLRGLPLLIPYDEVFHLKDLSADGLIGLSPISLAREAIAINLAQQQQQARLLGNGARPSGILTTDQKLTPEIAKSLKERWKEVHSGLLNTGQVAVLEAGLKWQPLTLSSVDMQFLQLMQFGIVDVCRIFRVPPHMVGAELGRGAMQNIVQQAQDYRNNTLTSHSDIWERRVDFTFALRRQGLFLDLDEAALLKADLAARFTAYRTAILTGWETRDEVRLKEGLNPRGGAADELMMPLNTGPIGGDGLGSDMNGTAPDGAGKPTEQVTPDSGSDADDNEAPSI